MLDEIFYLNKTWLKVIEEFKSFFVIGICSTTINYLVFLILFKLINLNYLFAGLLGFMTGAFISYYFNKNITFKSSVPLRYGLIKFIPTQMFSYLIHFSSQYSSVFFFDISEILSQLIGIFFSMLINFTLLKKVVFNF